MRRPFLRSRRPGATYDDVFDWGTFRWITRERGRGASLPLGVDHGRDGGRPGSEASLSRTRPGRRRARILWFRIPDLEFSSGWGTILGNSDGNREPFHAYILHISSLGLALNLRDTDKLNQIVRRPVDSTYVATWHHVAAVYDHGDRSWSGYLDGSLFGFTPIVGDLVRSGYFRTMLGAGYGSYSGHGAHYRGDLDDLRVYTRPLAQEEIVALSHEGGW